MYILKAQNTFDSAHFLSNYNGKCRNIHGHTWTVHAEVGSETLKESGEFKGMVTDFGDLKKDLKEMLDYFDHALIIEENSLRKETLENIVQDGFKVITIDFRSTAENFSKYFYDKLEEKGYNVRKITVFETPTNSATYER
ncbi:6-carboxy-5,6,7,8-tetrahydropterin synthase QueD [Gottschalkia acidurici 9a]|uniref:6-carboxy-5,6,7,8-tetrahydropterin synthase n=1 Tax=Gottschalkia acidurici (strain ATCC 7906 / DSM 604 / BCRC 14475 / CIP 104303 / KCTC 5404 / NCIMB 10678 / 9a) TaxID=1128398 RepID=K0B0P2_GOTA9|nr:6-carboxytetrahydropterin synthase QueD [Gottschalkia acidurici]AFS79598.1 6-carboxy-5,6,7,8-tetrahydropterin synthase QueD [Gottschalkia acidurici 9a]